MAVQRHAGTKTPVKIGLIAMIANMVFNLILVWSLDHVGLGHRLYSGQSK